MSACIGTNVNDIVGSTHDFLVVFNHDDGIAKRLQVFKHVDETLCVAAMESDAGFVEDVERTHKRGPQLSGEVDALAFTAAERVGGAVQGEIVQPDLEQEAKPFFDFGEQPFGDGAVVFVKFKPLEPHHEVSDGHFDEVGQALAPDFHPFGLRLQSCAVALGADGLSAIAAHHDAILNLILVLPDHFEKCIDAHLVVDVLVALGGQSVPQHVFFLLREFQIRLENREIVLGSPAAELVFPHAHLVAMPALHASVIDAERGVGNDQPLVDADDIAKAFAFGACTCR